MARRGGRTFARSSGSRPNRGWSYTQEAAFTNVPANSKVLLASFALSNPGIDVIILRCIGGISVASDQAAAAEVQIGAFGMILVTDQALAAGIASIPGPFTNGDDDGWFCHQSFAQQGDLVSGQGIVSGWYPIDTKGKRIVHGEGVSIALVAENAHATYGLVLYEAIRFLAQVRGTR